MGHPLDSAHVKLQRAEELLQAITGEVRDFLAVPDGSAPPDHLRAVIGDCLFNLRATLDLIFWALALQTGPKDPDRDRIFFPIFTDAAKFRAAQSGFGRYVEAAVVPVIEAVQPFRTRNAALAVLRTLSNLDKHRNVELAVASAAEPHSRFVRFDDPNVPVRGVELVLRAILRHVSADVLPKFEPLFESVAHEDR